jgi:hypothetical protein
MQDDVCHSCPQRRGVLVGTPVGIVVRPTSWKNLESCGMMQSLRALQQGSQPGILTVGHIAERLFTPSHSPLSTGI